jgi:hypothetical protein
VFRNCTAKANGRPTYYIPIPTQGELTKGELTEGESTGGEINFVIKRGMYNNKEMQLQPHSRLMILKWPKLSIK